MNWQHLNILAAANYLRERIASGDSGPRAKEVYEGLLDVLDPSRRAARLQREKAAAIEASIAEQTARARRATRERRISSDNRKTNVGNPAGAERRGRADRRTGRERRKP
ncbi:MAG: hypothetical protein HY047_15220 [Acidobacteria bacterium]|nr:hypothetical protein [Acidobacteriota bacterium]